MTSTTLAELSERFGLKHPDSAANLIRRANQQIARSSTYQKNFETLREKLLKTENHVCPQHPDVGNPGGVRAALILTFSVYPIWIPLTSP